MKALKLVIIGIIVSMLTGCKWFNMANRITGGYTDRAMQISLDMTREAGQDAISGNQIVTGVSNGNIVIDGK